ncbi:MAG: hypothetical protein Cons2KO_34870 [Congregibacter sp.]
MASPASLLSEAPPPQPGFTSDGDADSSLSMQDEQDSAWGWGDESLAPVAVEDVDHFVLGFYGERMYLDEKGRQMIDLLEKDYAYLAVIVTNEAGRPVVGAAPEITLDGSSDLVSPDETSPRRLTDATGALEFAVVGGDMGLDRVSVELGSATAELRVNVISLRAAGYPEPPAVDGVIPWDDLMRARVSYRDDEFHVAFPERIKAISGERVRLSGFMVPLDPDLTQKRFLLTSNPPSCFYHIPGGPAGAVEVSSSDGIEATWDPIVVEGRFETMQTDEFGVIYRLHEASVYQP